MIVRDHGGGEIEVLAPAKLNLFLEVLGKRPDGFHELETLMVAVDLHDALRFQDDPSGTISLTCDDPTLPVGRENLVVRAAEAVRSATGVKRGVRIKLAKAIPAEAGLAGGSSDAAATLAALDQLWGTALGREGLDPLAHTLGSDVAFFLNGPAAICRGRGERVEPLEGPRSLHFVMVKPPYGLSTAEVYRHVRVPESPRRIREAADALASGETTILGRCLFNRLQEAAETLRPELRSIRQTLDQLSPYLDGHLMSGSGSAYFGLARDLTAAHAAARQLDSLGHGKVRVVTCVPRDLSSTA